MTQAPALRYTRPDDTAPPASSSGTNLGTTGRYKRALELALEIEQLLEAESPPSSRLAYSTRIAQAMNRSLIDHLAEIVRDKTG
jgi:hypothetical protein